MNRETLKNALAKHIIVNNLPFLHVENESLFYIGRLVNPNAVKFIIKADAISDHFVSKYLSIKNDVAMAMLSDSVKVLNFLRLDFSK